jgi:hypothetical protein
MIGSPRRSTTDYTDATDIRIARRETRESLANVGDVSQRLAGQQFEEPFAQPVGQWGLGDVEEPGLEGAGDDRVGQGVSPTSLRIFTRVLASRKKPVCTN